MKEIGMLFSTDMVRAILDGKKIVTRRLMDPKAEVIFVSDGSIRVFKNKKNGGEDCRFTPHNPYAVGDRIYVRETWQETYDRKTDSWKPLYLAENINKIWIEDDGSSMKWRPSIHMPKKYARIWLEITSVNVQQVKDITEDEAVEEGFHRENSVCARFHFLTYMENKYGMDVLNKWCWVIGFKVVEK